METKGMKKVKCFIAGVVFTILAAVGAAQLGWVRIDIAVTEKGVALMDSAKAGAAELFTK